MDDVTREALRKFNRTISKLKLKGHSMLDYIYGAKFDEEEFQQPDELFKKFMIDVIAIHRRNNGQFSSEEANAILETDGAFRLFFESSERSTGFYSDDESFNRAMDKMTSFPDYVEYAMIVDTLSDISIDHFMDNKTDDGRAIFQERDDDLVALIPSTKSISGLFGVFVDADRILARPSFIEVKRSDTANTNQLILT